MTTIPSLRKTVVSSEEELASKALGDRPDDAVQAPPPVLDPKIRRNKALLRFGVSITVLTLVGHLLLGFEQPPLLPILAVLISYVTALILETIDAWARDRRPEFSGGRSAMFYFLLPPHIAALACVMLIYSSTYAPYFFAVVAAVASKYVFRVRVKGRLRHFLNPSNFGIALTLLLMPLVGFTPPYMFLNNTDNAVDVLIPLGVLMAGTMLNGKLTGKIPLILGWVGGYVLQALVRSLVFDDVLLATLGMTTGVAFILFTNYMITDPGTTPVDPKRQVLFGLSVAAVYGILIVAQVSYAIFFALFIVCAIRGTILFAIERVLRSSRVTTQG